MSNKYVKNMKWSRKWKTRHCQKLSVKMCKQNQNYLDFKTDLRMRCNCLKNMSNIWKANFLAPKDLLYFIFKCLETKYKT